MCSLHLLDGDLGKPLDLPRTCPKQIEGWGCLVALDAGDVLVRDAQLACNLVLRGRLRLRPQARVGVPS